MFRLSLPALLAAGLIAAAGLPSAAQVKKEKAKKAERFAVADPAKLKDDSDYAIRGEYEGEVKAPRNAGKVGAQVIARGAGKFEIKFHLGGLPGAGWAGGRTPTATAAAKDGKIVIRNEEKEVGEIGAGVITLTDPDVTGTLKKVERKSPTLGAQPPSGAVVLFAGPQDVDKWENGKVAELSDGKYLAASGTRSKQKFQSFQAHVEFRLAWMPTSTGQARSNSGVYVQDRYEIQVLDSFGLKGEDNECGGIYKESAPKVNMCLPPMQWQTYDIDFTAAEFDPAGKRTKPAVLTLRHNGVVIHDKLELKAATPGGAITKETPEPGALFLQNHGDPVVYRNIWVVEKK